MDVTTCAPVVENHESDDAFEIKDNVMRSALLYCVKITIKENSSDNHNFTKCNWAQLTRNGKFRRTMNMPSTVVIVSLIVRPLIQRDIINNVV